MRRPFPLLLAVICTAAVLTGCGAVGDPPAAKVGAQTISRTEFNDELSALADNKQWIQTLEQSGGFTAVAATEGTISTQISAAWLNLLVDQAIVDQVFQRRDLTVTDQDRTAARTAAINIFGNEATFGRLPKWLRDRILARQEKFAAVAASLPPKAAPSEASLRAQFDQSSAQVCPSGEAVLQIQVATQADADAIVSALAGGADFATLAKERSTDQQSAAGSGLISCRGTQQFAQLPQQMQVAATALAVGSVSPVVRTDVGFHVLKVVPWTFEIARPVLEASVRQQQSSPIQDLIGTKLVRSKVWVDPRYGKVVRQNGAVAIQPPRAPKPASNPPEASSSTTAPAGSTSP